MLAPSATTGTSTGEIRLHTTALASRLGLAGAALAGSAAAAVAAGDAAVAVLARAVSEAPLYTKGRTVSTKLLAIPAEHKTYKTCMWTHCCKNTALTAGKELTLKVCPF